MKNLIVLFVAALLTACGGSSSSVTATPASQLPASSVPPATSLSAIPLSNAIIDISGMSGDYLIQSASAVVVTVSGMSNTVEFSPNQAASSVSVTGMSNKIIFRSGTSVTSLTDTGMSNKYWIPSGSGIAISGVPDTTTGWNTYTP